MLVWVALALVFGALHPKLDDVTDDGTASTLPGDSQAAEVSNLLNERFDTGELRLALLVYRREGGLARADQRKIVADARRAAKDPLVPPDSVTAPFGPKGDPSLVSGKRDVAITVVPLSAKDPTKVPDSVGDLRSLQDDRAPAGLESSVTGEAALQGDITDVFGSADLKLLTVSALLVLLLLLGVYRSPVIALMPLIVVGCSYLITTGIIYLLARGGMQVDSTSLSVLAVLMFGVGTDYCLLLVARYSEDLRRIEDAGDALRTALPRAAPSIAASAATVSLALLVLLLADVESTKTLGPVNAIGVVTVMLASLTLLPAMLSIAGRAGFWPRSEHIAYRHGGRVEPELAPGLGPLPAQVRAQQLDEHPAIRPREGVWRRVGMRVLQRPKPALLGSAAVLAIAALGIFTYDNAADPVSALRGEPDSVKGYDLLRTAFPPGTVGPGTAVIESKDGPVLEHEASQYQARLQSVPGLLQVSGVTNRSKDGDAVTFSFLFGDDPYGDAAFSRVKQMRAALAEPIRPGARALVGDSTAIQLDYKDAAVRDNQVVMPLILLVIFLVLAFLLRALVAPLYLIATVMLSFLGVLGFTLFVFKEIGGEPGFDPALPLFAFVFLVALGVDYTIFLMSRVREEALEHGTRDGVLRALVATGPVITSAGLILAGSFAALMTLPINVLFQVGFAVAVGVLIDTFIVRTLMVPAIVQLVGDLSWWPTKVSGGQLAPVVSDTFKRSPNLERFIDELPPLAQEAAQGTARPSEEKR